MALYLSRIELVNFRNHEDLSVDFSRGLNVFVGPNAVGKTNTVEAIQLLTTGRSFRKPSPKNLLLEGRDAARISARIEGDGRALDHSCDISEGKRSFSKNGKHCSAGDIAGELMSILFNPDDLSFAKGSASNRRSELDDFASQANAGYANVLASYTRSIEQRNRLLKELYVDENLLDAWDESIAVGAATLLVGRYKLVERLREQFVSVYGEISLQEKPDCRYVCSLGDDLEGMAKEEMAEVIRRRLLENRAEDIRRQQTTIGPHRDDIAFFLDDRDVRNFASQGQQRSVVVAWKMAEVRLAAEISGSQPLLLLDDVMSELDENRRTAMGEFISGNIQTVITTTNLGYFTEELLENAKVTKFDV